MLFRSQPLGAADLEFLLDAVRRHAEFTGSPVAQRIAADWTTESARFKRVMPIDYQRVLTVMEQASAEGLDEAATLDRVMEASRG